MGFIATLMVLSARSVAPGRKMGYQVVPVVVEVGIVGFCLNKFKYLKLLCSQAPSPGWGGYLLVHLCQWGTQGRTACLFPKHWRSGQIRLWLHHKPRYYLTSDLTSRLFRGIIVDFISHNYGFSLLSFPPAGRLYIWFLFDGDFVQNLKCILSRIMAPGLNCNAFNIECAQIIIPFVIIYPNLTAMDIFKMSNVITAAKYSPSFVTIVNTPLFAWHRNWTQSCRSNL